MALVESYAPCPCGSGEKYKWCCHKAESFAERSLRLQETGALEQALAAAEEGLRKFPDTPWLLIRKAFLLVRLERLADAAAALRGLLAKHPEHVGAHNFLVRTLVEGEGVEVAARQFQEALSHVPAKNRPPLGLTAQLLGAIFGEEGHVPAALAHFRLGEQLQGEDADPMLTQSRKMIDRNAGISPWLRNPYRLTTPAGLSGAPKDRFDKALAMADSGMWSEAGDEFATLADSGVPGAGRNLGLCRLWVAEDAEAVVALRRHIQHAGPTEESVDLEALCQLIAPPQHDEPIEHLQLTWPIRDRNALLKALAADPAMDPDGQAPIDPDDPNSPVADWFALLDRPKPADVSGLSVLEMPRVEGHVCVEPKSVALDFYDDGRHNRLTSRFVESVGTSIPPAHPRTKVLETLPRSSVVLRSELWMPTGIDRAVAEKLSRDEQARVILEVWPGTRLPYLDRKTPRQVAGDPRYEAALRAAICQFEFGQDFRRSGIAFDRLREELKVAPEPDVDPAKADVESLHLARLHRVPAAGLDDARLVAFYRRAHEFVLPLAMENAALAVLDRPAILDRGQVDRVIVFADLSHLAQTRGDMAEAASWLARGRQADRTPRNAIRWDFLDVRLRTRSEPPEQWVPALAMILEQYREDREASSFILTNLVEWGLVQMSPNPDNPDQMLLDTRMLQSVLARYGPKITTASGRLGVSATKAGIWTPGAEAGGSGGGLWTPGSAPPPAAGPDKPKLILPGR